MVSGPGLWLFLVSIPADTLVRNDILCRSPLRNRIPMEAGRRTTWPQPFLGVPVRPLSQWQGGLSCLHAGPGKGSRKRPGDPDCLALGDSVASVTYVLGTVSHGALHL